MIDRPCGPRRVRYFSRGAVSAVSEETEVVEVLDAEEVEQVCEEAENVPMVEVVEVMEPEVVVDEGGRSKGRPKRRRNA